MSLTRRLKELEEIATRTLLESIPETDTQHRLRLVLQHIQTIREEQANESMETPRRNDRHRDTGDA